MNTFAPKPVKVRGLHRRQPFQAEMVSPLLVGRYQKNVGSGGHLF
jgi:hypothetical protein